MRNDFSGALKAGLARPILAARAIDPTGLAAEADPLLALAGEVPSLRGLANDSRAVLAAGCRLEDGQPALRPGLARNSVAMPTPRPQ